MEKPQTEESQPPPQPELTKEQMKALIETRTAEIEATATAESSVKTKLKMTSDGCISQTVSDIPAVSEGKVDAEDFIAAESHTGSRPGFVYKQGPQGLGYYKDDAGRLLKALHKLESEVDPRAASSRALESLNVGNNTPSDATQGAEIDGEAFEFHFTEPKWGMTTRMASGPVTVTKLKDSGQAKTLGLQIGDVITTVAGISVSNSRSEALSRLRKGGDTVISVVRPANPVTESVEAVGDSAAVNKLLGGGGGGDGDQVNPDWSVRKMQAMIGAAKAKDTVAVAQKRGVTETIADGAVDANTTLVFVGCEDCTYTLESYCVKLYVQDCKNLTINANTRIITSMIEVFKGESITLNINTDCGTLQADMVNGLTATFINKERFTMAVWAGCENVSMRFADSSDRLDTGYSVMAASDSSLRLESSQFKVSYVNGRLTQEKLIRLENGFTTTQREKDEFERKQEANMKAMAKKMGITIGPAKDGIKVKPNEPCPCGSGLKFKKCCPSVDGVYRGKVATSIASNGDTTAAALSPEIAEPTSFLGS